MRRSDPHGFRLLLLTVLLLAGGCRNATKDFYDSLAAPTSGTGCGTGGAETTAGGGGGTGGTAEGGAAGAGMTAAGCTQTTSSGTP